MVKLYLKNKEHKKKQGKEVPIKKILERRRRKRRKRNNKGKLLKLNELKKRKTLTKRNGVNSNK
jgi:hypothetical protein